MEGLRTPAVRGSLTPAAALEKLLRGTGFSFSFENPRSALLLRAKDSDQGLAVNPMPSLAPGVMEAGTAELRIAKTEIDTPEVTVTGSYLHGVLDIMSPIAFVTREEMQSSPYGTVQDALQSLPVNLLSSQNENTGGVGNFNRGSAPNLRGLGYGATLVLVNGRRQPAAGSTADFVDLSNIPWSAVDHIEILPDGASALYGSDAIAGVINVIMRDRLDGAETRLRTSTAEDGASQTLVGQLFGRESEAGRWLFGYQYSRKTSLAAADRAYAANQDKRAFGGRDFRSARSNPGNILDPATFAPAFAIPAGQDGRDLLARDLLTDTVNLQNELEGYDLVPNRRMHSVYLNGAWRAGEHVELFLDARASQREVEYPDIPASQLLFVPDTNPFFVDPFGGSPVVVVAYNFRKDLGLLENLGRTRNSMTTAGAHLALAHDWNATLSAGLGVERLRFEISNLFDQAALDAALADPDPLTAFDPFGDGSNTNPATLEAIRTSHVDRADSKLRTVNLIADGPVLEMPAGNARLAVGLERRQESLQRNGISSQSFGRRVESAFAELSLPLLGAPDDVRAAPRLELSLSGRYERYSDFGDAFNPKLGLQWSPLRSLKMRTSWGTSFKAPKLVDLYDTSDNASGVLPFPDPRSPTGVSLVAAMQGTNPDLKEEAATTWTAGLDLAPARIPGLTLSMTYFDIDYRDQIIQPGPTFPFEILFQEDQWPGVVTRDPALEAIEAICRRPDLLISAADCLASHPVAIVDLRLRNLAATKTRGIDFSAVHHVISSHGTFLASIEATKVLRFRRSVSSTSPDVDLLDSVNNPLSFRARGVLKWNQSNEEAQPGWGARAALTFADSYRDRESPLLSRVSSYVTVDMQWSYRFGERNGILDRCEVRLNAVNLFDQNPPFVDRSFGFDVLNAQPYGRVVGLSVEKAW